MTTGNHNTTEGATTMCGIAGFNLTTRDARPGVSDTLTRELLLGIEHRGRDATGIAWRRPDGTVWHSKAAEAASKVARGLAAHATDARTVICHTRFATKGTPEVEGNNHPIDHDGIVLVHNGVLTNDDELFAMTGAPRYAEVDSEALAALLSHGPDVFDDADPWRLLELVEGRAAIAWLRVADTTETLRLARVHASPLIIGQTVGGSFLFGSTRDTIKNAAKAAGMTLPWLREVPEGTYLRVRDGRLCDWLGFDAYKPKVTAPTGGGRKWDDYNGSLFATAGRK